MVLLNGPVQNALFCLLDRYQNVCVWFMARNCRFPRLELSVANVGTTGYHCKELPVPRGWNSWFLYSSQPGNQRLPLQATAGSRGWNSRFPTWKAQVTIARNCRFPEVGTLGSQPGNHGLPWQATVKMIRKHFRYNFMVLLNGPVQNAFFAYWTGTGMLAFGSWQGTAGSQRLELSVANVGTTGYHCKELPVPRGWNSWFPTWEPEVTIASNCRFPEVGTHASQPGNHRLPLQGTAGPKRLELFVPNLGTMGYHCKQLFK